VNARLTLRTGIRIAPRFVLACLGMSAIALADGSGGGALRAGPAFANDVEGSLVRAIVGLREHGMKQAMGEIDGILDRTPNFRLGHLVKGDMLMARAGKPMAFASLGTANASMAPLQDEARVRLKRYLDAPRVDDPPAPVLQLARSQSHVLLVDTTRSRLFVYANDLGGRPRYVGDFYISLGRNDGQKSDEGDQKTPLGVYKIIDKRAGLPDFYGPNAYPIDYPNDLDRMEGRRATASGCTARPRRPTAAAPRATDGCIVLTNDDLAKVSKYVDVAHTPVVIVDKLEWRDPERWEATRDEFLASFARWKADWESRDVERYFAHYAKDFRADRALASWKAQKRKVNAGKTWIKVGVNEMSLFAYPGAKDMIVVDYEQDYRSNNLSNRTTKRQYWVRRDGSWRILHEAVVS
jgi:murein L,D-transpeptidase YafK